MKSKTITENRRKFHKLLVWLGKDTKSATQKYESIRRNLTKMLSAKGCYEAEELADETIDRVTRKIDMLAFNYVGDPSLYFYGVAKRVFLEFTRRPIKVELPHLTIKEDDGAIDTEKQSQCLSKCLEKLSSKDSKLIIEYYKKDKSEKIKHRKRLAQNLGISTQALRVRVFRIRKNLQECFFDSID